VRAFFSSNVAADDSVLGGWCSVGKGLITTGRHLLILDTPVNSSANVRPTQQRFFSEPIIAFNLLSEASAPSARAADCC
jgi:hypothetical protein